MDTTLCGVTENGIMVDLYGIPSAKTAKEETKKKATDEFKEHLEHCSKKIIAAIRDGQSRCTTCRNFGLMFMEVKDYLVRQGYTVTAAGTQGDEFLQIQW